MSEIGLNINVDSCNNEGIKTIKGNNNAEIYKLYILKNKRRLSLVGKTVKFGYVMAGTSKGDIIENLNITNAEQGEITFPITNRISKKDGVYSCQLAIYGADEFLEYTATFGLTVEANIFTKIAGEIENSKDLTYIERILEEAKTVSGDLKTNIPVATNLNSSLESNISNARNINTTLADTAEKSKVAATDAIEKKSQLESSIVEAKKFIDGLDGSQDIPGIRMELTELQNGLKSNQALAYQGSSITANDTLEGRTEGMKIKGRTLYNLEPSKNISMNISKWNTFTKGSKDMYKPNTKYTVIVIIEDNKLTEGVCTFVSDDTNTSTIFKAGTDIVLTKESKGIYTKVCTTKDNLENCIRVGFWAHTPSTTKGSLVFSMMILEGDWKNKEIPNYFEGIKSFGEAEQEGDKYKISILSGGLNRCTNESINGFININVNNAIQPDTTAISYIAKVYKGGTYYLSKIGGDRSVLGYFKSYPKIGDVALNVASGSITVPSHGYIVAYVSSNKNTNNPTNIMISENVSADFQPYQEDKKDILISAPLPGFDFGEDIMYEDNGQVKITRNIDNYIFTGNETMRDTTEQDEKSGTGKYKVFALTVNKTIDINKNINNNFPKEQFNVAFQNMDSEGLAVTQYGVYIKILKSKLSTQDTEGFKAWLKANQTVIYFVRATPVTEIIDNCVDIDLDTFQEKTYFNILNSLPGTLDFKVPSNIGSLVQSNAKEINNINEFINNFILKALLEMNKDLAAIKIKNGLN
ncbi:BppU family phage baseplate upper protein [Clostridium perfringens]|uniref:BppU family phage baseplate upper protein n=1 Tax=Clostridium perfringens TaxID=1502 RepID=UPI001ABACE2C|nr:BppU family phage baseplate upper protein [Clostridium perfringens]MBO3424711.1 BppU family phage baseplate upper protein [Clostridium perfringens]